MCLGSRRCASQGQGDTFSDLLYLLRFRNEAGIVDSSRLNATGKWVITSHIYPYLQHAQSFHFFLLQTWQKCVCSLYDIFIIQRPHLWQKLITLEALNLCRTFLLQSIIKKNSTIQHLWACVLMCAPPYTVIVCILPLTKYYFFFSFYYFWFL